MASTLRLSSRALRFASPAPLRAFNGRAYSTGKTTVCAPQPSLRPSPPANDVNRSP